MSKKDRREKKMFLQEACQGVAAVDLNADNSAVLATIPEITDEQKTNIIGSLGEDLKRLLFFSRQLGLAYNDLFEKFNWQYDRTNQEERAALMASSQAMAVCLSSIKFEALQNLFFASLQLAFPQVAGHDQAGIARFGDEIVLYAQNQDECVCPVCASVL
ncbi:MAG TPA: hypothetical protein PK412_02330 [bacterium]|nr:hypothetical protein [bacterium]HPN81363.1 hypothetical protein [bacterium]HQA63832.1 hypothetical protein [bacterium]